MNATELKARTQRFGLRVLDFVAGLPPGRETDVLGRQLIRSATSVGANYRAACRARSRNDFVAKIKVVEEEADESGYWLEVLAGRAGADRKEFQQLLDEAEELTAIFAASARTARSGGNRQSSINARQCV